MEERVERTPEHDGDMIIDNVLTTQPELGPTIPDGGYGWVVFLASLFFQALIPSLLVSFGIFLAFDRIERNTLVGKNPLLWDNTLLHVPLFFVASWTFFDSASRHLISQSTWPKLIATAGNCLTCAGLLFVWIGMTGSGKIYLYILAGIVAGFGASIQMAQCEILVAQYFRLKLPLLTNIAHAVSAIGFILAPIIIGHHILTNSLMQIILWYQAIILQGLVVNLLFKKPIYLKSGNTKRYNYVTTNPDDEEDIFSKNTRELQIKVQNHHGVQVQNHEIPPATNLESAESSNSNKHDKSTENMKEKNEDTKDWVTFEDEEDEEVSKYVRVKDWETFEDEETGSKAKADPLSEAKADKPVNLESFDGPENSKKNDPNERNHKNLHLEMSYGKDEDLERPTTMSVNGMPIPLFADTPVNHNNTYSYDILEDQTHSSQPTVFMPQQRTNAIETFSRTTCEVLRQPTFYKSLITVITTKWSFFVFFSMFPCYFYQEVIDLKMRQLSNLVGAISIATLLFSGAPFMIEIDKRHRPKMMMALTWVGALGYLMIADYVSEGVLLFGAVQIVLSLAALQHVGSSLLGLTVKGESTKEYALICVLSGLSFLLFTAINFSFKQVFRTMGILHFSIGFLWLGNYIYKRLRMVL